MARKRVGTGPKKVETITHSEATRTYIPTAEYRSLVSEDVARSVRVAYERRNRDLDPQLVWRGKDEQDWSDLVVPAPPLYIQEKVHPKVLIDDLMREKAKRQSDESGQLSLFADFDGDLDDAARTEFYRHEANWSNRMILGDSLQVMASLAEREGLRGKVQCIYIDPPYGIKFNSNFQWSTTSRDVKDGKAEHITREPEQVKAFRDTWRDGIHSYLTYLRDRLTVARDLLTESGSIFVQIGDENVHRVRALMDEVFGAENFVSAIAFRTSVGLGAQHLDRVYDSIVWFARSKANMKYRQAFMLLERGGEGASRYNYVSLSNGEERLLTAEEKDDEARIPQLSRFFTDQGLTSRTGSETTLYPLSFFGTLYRPTVGGWRTSNTGLQRLKSAGRVLKAGATIRFKKYFDDFGAVALTNFWSDLSGGIQSRTDPKIYAVQTNTGVVQRCILMTTDPGDLVLDPTCGSGTTAYVAEQWGRRWITIDTSRVALALARARLMGARYPYYLLADSPEGLRKEAEVSGRAWIDKPTYHNVRQGFVYERVPHITLKSIANNAEIDVIWEQWQPKVQEALDKLNADLRGHTTPFRVTTGGREGKQVRFDAPADALFTMPSGEQVPASALVEWEVPRAGPEDWPASARQHLEDFWAARIGRQKQIDESIAAKADFEYLFDRPYEDKKTVRVAGPFTVESLSPHRVIGVHADGSLLDGSPGQRGEETEEGFVRMILENLRVAGVQQAHREARIRFSSLVPWPGRLICAEGRYTEREGAGQKRAAVFVGPEFGTVTRPDLVEAAREAADAGFDVLITCAFNYEAHTTEFNQLGRLPVLKARMNADLHMAEELKTTDKANLFVVFGEPDIDILEAEDGMIRVKVKGIDIFKPQEGRVEKSEPDELACWFIDTDYNEESFFVRHAYFLGANDPYKSLKTSLKAEIDRDAWETLHSDTSRPFPKPASGRIAVKVINHLGDEVMKVFRVD